MDRDTKLRRWSMVLLLLALATLARGLSAPFFLLLEGGPILLTKGQEVWQSRFESLPTFEAGIVFTVLTLPQVAWLYGVLQIVRLARCYRRGTLFGPAVSGAFLHLGAALATVGLLNSLTLPAVAAVLYHRGICPWLADMPVFAILDLDLIMAGAFFFVLGKIMRRGAELEEADRLTV